jgi:hypothetical protein
MWTYCPMITRDDVNVFLTWSTLHRNAISGTQILEPSLANSSLRYSAHTFGDRILSWGRARREWALWQFCPTLTKESLKNVLFWRTFQGSYPFKYLRFWRILVVLPPPHPAAGVISIQDSESAGSDVIRGGYARAYARASVCSSGICSSGICSSGICSSVCARVRSSVCSSEKRTNCWVFLNIYFVKYSDI